MVFLTVFLKVHSLNMPVCRYF